LKQEPSVTQILQSIGDVSQYKEIVFCGLGEPTLRLDTLLSIAKQLKEKSCFIRLNTDGLANYLYQRDITVELADVIDAVSVSLNAQNESIYAEQCRPPEKNLRNEVIKFIRSTRKNIANVTLTAIDGLPGVDTNACFLQAKELDVTFKKRTLDQVG
jgi:TatD DNase family protein